MDEYNNNNLISEDQTEGETESINLPEQKRKVYTDQGDPEVDSMYRKWKEGDLDIQPDFQRGFVWDIVKASRLIESILLDIPLPIIYLSQEKDGKEYVIDGQQRLTSFFSFIDGRLPDPILPHGKDFKLNSLNVISELNNKSFKDLPKELQKKIKYSKIRTITFRKESEQDLKFEVFERLNTGSVSLNDQELRNCIYRGPYNDLLWELSEDTTFKYLLGIKKPEKRMRDVELVLRFAAFYHASYINYKPPIKKFLNNEMEKYRNISSKDADELRSVFKKTVTLIKSILGENAFKRYYTKDQKPKTLGWEKTKFNASLYDILMDSFARRDKNLTMRNLDSIREAFIDLMTSDQLFISSIELSTSSTQAVNYRFKKWESTLDTIFSITEKEPRSFSTKVKDELYRSNPYCAICNQRIREVDDAAVDHINQYWAGGATIPENARLTHRYCNNARSRNDVIHPSFKVPRLSTRISLANKNRIIEIDGERLHCPTSVSILKNTANCMIKKGKILKRDCPILISSNGEWCLINTTPFHPNGVKFTPGNNELVDGFYIEKNFSTADCIKKSKELLAYCGITTDRYNLDE